MGNRVCWDSVYFFNLCVSIACVYACVCVCVCMVGGLFSSEVRWSLLSIKAHKRALTKVKIRMLLELDQQYKTMCTFLTELPVDE